MLVRPGVEVVDVVLNIATVAAEDRALAVAAQALQQPARHLEIGCGLVGVEKRRAPLGAVSPGDVVVCIHGCRCPRCAIATLRPRHRDAVRSEEHTTELQSLMRISYAVFCLKTKTYSQTHTPKRSPH